MFDPDDSTGNPWWHLVLSYFVQLLRLNGFHNLGNYQNEYSSKEQRIMMFVYAIECLFESCP